MVRYDVDSRIATQIENSADYYPPATYSGTSYPSGGASPTSYLTYYNELTINADSLADQFIPLSAVAQRARNPKLFAIGVLPPTANISGLLLDRTASINQIVEPIYEQKAGQAPPPPSVERIRGLTVDQKNDKFGKFSYVPAPTPKNPEAIKVTDDWATKNLITVTIPQLKGVPGYHSNGQIMLHKAVAGQFQAFFAAIESYGLSSQILAFGGAYDARFVRGSSSTLSPHAWGTAVDINHPYNGWGQKPAPEDQKGSCIPFVGIAESMGLTWGGRFQTQDGMHFEAAAIVDVEPPDLLPTSQALQGEQPGKWNGAVADDASRMMDKTANTPLTAEDMAQRFSAAQFAQIKEIQTALDAMMNTPPLRMLVNPTSFSVKGEKIVSDGGWVRNGKHVVEHWGDQQEKISASGKVAGFYAIDVLNALGPGLSRGARNYSQAWQNFQSLTMFYKNNGRLHTLDATTNNSALNLAMVGSIYLYYDGILYLGSFDSLGITETDTAPHTVEYSFEFSVRAAFLLDSPDPNARGNDG